MIEKFATGCCLYSVLDRSFDLRDANTVRHVTIVHFEVANICHIAVVVVCQ